MNYYNNKTIVLEWESTHNRAFTKEQLVNRYNRTTKIIYGFGLSIVASGALTILPGLLYHYGVVQQVAQETGLAHLGSAHSFIWDPTLFSGILLIAIGSGMIGIGLYRKGAHRKIHGAYAHFMESLKAKLKKM